MAVNTDPPVQLQPNTSESDKVSFINQNFRKLSDSLSPFQISDGNNNILNIGKDSNGDYTMKVAKPGYDAFDAADENLIFNSNQNVFKILEKVTGNIVINFPSVSSGNGNQSSFAYGTNFEYYHNLGVRPSILAFYGGGSWAQPISQGSLYGNTDLGPFKFELTNFFVQVEDNKIVIGLLRTYNVVSGSPMAAMSANVPITVYILQETAQ